jgi:5'-nucleotidase
VKLVPKKADGTPIKSRTDAIADPRESTGSHIPMASGSMENEVAVTSAAQKEMKEWQAIMNYLLNLPNKNAAGISILKKDDRAKEVRAIKRS